MVVYFRGEPILQPNSSGHKFEITQAWICIIDAYVVTIKKGFWTDLASIPRVLQNIFSPLSRNMKAAILHDWLYYEQEIEGNKITRKYADNVFLNGMKKCGVGYIRRNIMYQAVRSFGWIAWNKYKK